MADPNGAMRRAVDHIAQIARPRHAERAQGKRAIIDIGHDLAMAEIKALLQPERQFPLIGERIVE